jgi:peptide deformylase
MRLDIVQHPDPRLREVCAPVDKIDADLIENMFETMYLAPGRGIAGPQVGVMERVFVMDATWKEGDMSPLAFINPQITASGGTQVNEEACLSIADHAQSVTRPEWVEVTWTDLDGSAKAQRFDGFAAACVCHEMDHLDGRLILDYGDAA